MKIILKNAEIEIKRRLDLVKLEPSSVQAGKLISGSGEITDSTYSSVYAYDVSLFDMVNISSIIDGLSIRPWVKKNNGVVTGAADINSDSSLVNFTANKFDVSNADTLYLNVKTLQDVTPEVFGIEDV